MWGRVSPSIRVTVTRAECWRARGAGSSADTEAGDAQDADAYVSDYFSASDVVINPAYGSWDGSNVTQGSGSLSDPVSSVARAALPKADGTTDVATLPPSQVCG